MGKQSFEHQMIFISVRISVELPSNSGTSIGTGFLYNQSLNDGTNRFITLLVSNKHVFVNPNGKLKVSFNRKDSNGEPIYGNICNFEDSDFQAAYFEHPDPGVDLACVTVSNVSRTEAYYRTLSHDFLIEIDYEKIAPGTEVIFVGYPANRYDVANNLPLVRKGSIASAPEVDFNGKGQIVIDAQVYQGSSGSPVFVAIDNRYLLLGVVSETMIRNAKLQTLPAVLPNLGIQEILGLGIVIKQRHLKELFEHTVKEFLLRAS